MRRFFAVFLIFVLLITAGCGEQSSTVSQPTEADEPVSSTGPDRGEIAIVFTGGLNGEYAQDAVQGKIGYAVATAYHNMLKGTFEYTVFIDGGASLRASDSDKLWDIVDSCGYEIRVVGDLELADGVQALLRRAGDLKDCVYLSCNLVDPQRNALVFDPYTLVDAGDIQIGFVGVTDPSSLSAADASEYTLLGQNDPQELYDAVQKAVDDAANAGAEYVIVVGNLGTDPGDSPLTTVEVIANITDFHAWLDCGSGAVLDGAEVTDKDDFPIPVCAPGSGFRYVGRIILNLNDGTVEMELLTDLDEEDRTVKKLVDALAES